MRVDFVEVEGVGVQVAVHHFDAEPRFQRTAGAEGVAEEALLRADRHVFAEQAAGGQGFGDVALFGGGAVAVDVADVRRFQPGVLQGQFHGPAHGDLFGTGGVLAVGVAAETDDLGMDAGATGQGVFQFLEHQHAAAFADHQAVACGVVGARAALWGVVLQAGGVERVEDHGFGRAQFLGTAGEHQRQAPELDRLVGIADALAAAGAGAGGGNQATGEAEEDADIGRGGVRHHPHVGVGVQAFGHRVEQHVAERLDLVGAAGGGAAGDAHAPVLDRFVAQQAGVGQRHLRRTHGKPRDPAHAAQLLAGPVAWHLEVIDGGCQACVEFGKTIPLVHPADAAAVGREVAGDGVPVAAQ
ncbi:hypothetical protein D3C80_982540 [compost metagenome]